MVEHIEISVIIPTYNRGSVVCDAIDSVLKQTFLNYIKEIIIVDDGSIDGTENIINQKYKNNKLIKYIKKTNGGVSSARNIGMNNSIGNWIALLDSDDEWLESKIELQVKEIIKYPEIDFLGTNYNNKELRIGVKRINKLYKASVRDLCIKFFPVTPSMIFRKSIIEIIGGFNEKQKYAEDGEFCLRVCQNFNYYHMPVSLVKTGHGKRSFGESGLSGNLKEMYLGNVKNIKGLLRNGSIGRSFYIFLRFFYYAKYLRRILICKFK